MQHIKRDLDYYYGYVSSSEKLREFLDEYRHVTNMVFTVRSSRSYIKKRALDAVKRYAELNEGDELVIGATQTLDIPADVVADEQESNDGGELVSQELNMVEEEEREEEMGDVDNDILSASCLHNKENVTSNVDELTIMDGLITGKILWISFSLKDQSRPIL